MMQLMLKLIPKGVNLLNKNIKKFEMIALDVKIDIYQNDKLEALYSTTYEEMMERMEGIKGQVKEFKNQFMIDDKRRNEEEPTEELIRKTKNILQGDVRITDDLITAIGQTMGIGNSVMNELQAQKEDLTYLNIKYDDIENQVDQSKDLLLRFRRALMKDKCIRGLMVVFLVSVLLLVIWAIIDPYVQVNGGNSTTPVDVPKL